MKITVSIIAGAVLCIIASIIAATATIGANIEIVAGAVAGGGGTIAASAAPSAAAIATLNVYEISKTRNWTLILIK